MFATVPLRKVAQIGLIRRGPVEAGVAQGGVCGRLEGGIGQCKDRRAREGVEERHVFGSRGDGDMGRQLVMGLAHIGAQTRCDLSMPSGEECIVVLDYTTLTGRVLGGTERRWTCERASGRCLGGLDRGSAGDGDAARCLVCTTSQ